jgi:acyl-coenzyme A synthetase/AMP-(fatty) acid ligase
MAALQLPERLNSATVFVDTHIAEGRGAKPAILSGDRTVTYDDLREGVNRVGGALRELGVRMEERVAILLPDSPEWVFTFFGAMKIGAVAVPMNTMLLAKDYQYLLNDSRAQVLVVAPSLLDRITEIRESLRYTHDKFLMDEDGYFWYAGRTDDMIKVSGQAVWPADVEGMLQEHPAVLESGVVGTADPDGLIKPVAYVVLKDHDQRSPELARELQDFIKKHASPNKSPRGVTFVDSLPKTATGKIKRYKLRETAAEETPLHK